MARQATAAPRPERATPPGTPRWTPAAPTQPDMSPTTIAMTSEHHRDVVPNTPDREGQSAKRLANPMRSAGRKHCSTTAYSEPSTRSSSSLVSTAQRELAPRKTASSAPMAKWAPTSRSLRRSRCS